MKILALEKETPGISANQVKQYLKAEAIHLYRLHQAGVLREFYFKNNDTQCVMMLECDSVEDAQHILNGLPLVKQGLIRFELIALSPSPGFSRLYADQMNALT